MFKSKKQTLEQGALILVLSAILSKIIGALFKIPLSSEFCLGDFGFGHFSAAYDFVNPFILLSVSGLPVAVSKLVSEYNYSDEKGEINKVFTVSRKLFALAGFAVLTVSLILILILIGLTDKKDSLYCFIAIVPSFLFCFVASSYRGYFEGLTNMIPPAVSALIESLSKLVLGFSFAIVAVKLTSNAALGGAAALFGVTLGTVFSCLYLHLSYKKNGIKDKNLKINQTEDKLLLKKIAVIAFPIALYAFSGSIVGLVDSITVRAQLEGLNESLGNIYSTLLNEGAENLVESDLPTILYGIRSKGFTLYNIVPTLTAYLGVSAVPYISMAFENGDMSLLQKNSNKVLKLSAFISFPAGIGFMALHKGIMFLLFGESVSSRIGGNMLLFFGIAAAFSGVAVVMGNILQAVGKQNKALVNVAIGVAVKLIFNLILCGNPEVNIYGSAISTALCFAVVFVLNYISLKVELKGIKIKSDILKILLAAFLCGISAYWVSLANNSVVFTVLAILAAVAVYMIFILLLKPFSKEEIADLPFGKHISRFFKG